MDLFKSMKRLLEFSGSQVNTVSESEDGVVFDVEISGEKVRVFVTKQLELPRQENLEDFYHLNDVVNY